MPQHRAGESDTECLGVGLWTAWQSTSRLGICDSVVLGLTSVAAADLRSSNSGRRHPAVSRIWQLRGLRGQAWEDLLIFEDEFLCMLGS